MVSVELVLRPDLEEGTGEADTRVGGGEDLLGQAQCGKGAGGGDEGEKRHVKKADVGAQAAAAAAVSAVDRGRTDNCSGRRLNLNLDPFSARRTVV